jgi:hypothetical protein
MEIRSLFENIKSANSQSIVDASRFDLSNPTPANPTSIGDLMNQTPTPGSIHYGFES